MSEKMLTDFLTDRQAPNDPLDVYTGSQYKLLVKLSYKISTHYDEFCQILTMSEETLEKVLKNFLSGSGKK